MQLTQIQFNYSANHGVVNALTIRKNYGTAVSTPEWVSGQLLPEESPAAYSIPAVAGKSITVQVTVTGGNGVINQIQAVGGGILGPIAPTSITPGAGPTDFVLELAQHNIGEGGVIVANITWNWSYEDGTGAWAPLGITNHRIYVVLDTPTLPWIQPNTPQAPLEQLPWTDALDYACTWAAGSRTELQAAAAITSHVNSSLGLTYDIQHGASAYTQSSASNAGPSWFLCTMFLSYLNGNVGKGNTVNCTDCATIVSTFSNLLGCQLSAAVMASPTHTGFLCNKIIAVGGAGWNYPFAPQNLFSYHEVAWTGGLSYSDNIFDACLEADNSSNPWNWSPGRIPPIANLPVNVVFTSQPGVPNLPLATPFTAAGYRERLAQNSPGGIGSCQPQGPWSSSRGGRRGVL